MTLSDQTSKAYDFASDLVKQLISLSTGVLTLTLAFYDDFLKTSDGPTGWIIASWFVFLLSMGAGVISLMGQTGSLTTNDNPTLTSKLETRPAQAQVILFIIAFVLMVIAVIASSRA